jgi:hypothetical protein
MSHDHPVGITAEMAFDRSPSDAYQFLYVGYLVEIRIANYLRSAGADTSASLSFGPSILSTPGDYPLHLLGSDVTSDDSDVSSLVLHVLDSGYHRGGWCEY